MIQPKVLCILALALISFSGLVRAELMDPTRPPDFNISGHVGVNALKVDAIVYSKERKIAVINGMPLREGQTFEGNRVVEIEGYAVQVEGSNGRITLNLVRQPIKVQEPL